MINLMDDEGGKGAPGILGEGWHEVTVGKHREFKAKTGSPGVEYTVSNEHGSIGVTFYITPAAKFRLKLFAQTCGLAEVKLRNFDFADLAGKRVRVKAEKNDRGYLDVTDWASADAPAPDEWD